MSRAAAARRTPAPRSQRATATLPRPRPSRSPYLVTSRPSKVARRLILNGLIAFNREKFGLARWHEMAGLRRRPLAVLMRDAKGRVVGGILGQTFWGWAYLELVWLPADLRRQGHGTRLMELAEGEARRRGCIGIRLDTASFQAPDFYPKLGFKLHGVIEDLPPGHRLYHYIKRLRP